MSEGLFQVEKLVCARGSGYGLNLIVEKIIEIGCIEGPAAGEKILLETCFEGSSAFRQQASIRGVVVGNFAKSFVEGGFHVSDGIGKTQACSRKKFSTA